MSINSGYILGIVRQAGRPLSGAFVCLDRVALGEHILPTYSADADITGSWHDIHMPQPMNPRAQTNSDGAFMVAFTWAGHDIGTGAVGLICQVFVLTEEATSRGVTMRMRGRFRAPMITTVSLSQVSGGLIPNPTQIGDRIGMGVDIHTVLRGFRRPMIGLTIAPPSGNAYALVAGFRINL
jgi:hypothetical protein